MPRTMKISTLINELQALKKEYGNLPVYLSSDEEGNSFGTLDAELSFGIDENEDIPVRFILYPCEQIYDFGD